MNKIIAILIVLGAAAVFVAGWVLVSSGQVQLPSPPTASLPSPTPVTVSSDATTQDMMDALQSTVDDGGASELQKIQQEVNQL